MQIYNLSCLALPIIGYFIARKYHLHVGELWMLVYAAVLVISTLIDGWVMQVTHLILITALSIHVLGVSKETSGQLSQNNIIIYAMSAWLILRVYTSKSFQWGIGLTYDQGQAKNQTFQGLNITLNGWNCTQLQQVFIPMFWLVINLLSYYIAKEIIKVESDKDNLYKQYVVKYVVLPFVTCSVLVGGYNLWAYVHVDGMLDCMRYWDDAYLGTLAKLAEYFGFSYSVLNFFHAKKGVFQVQGEENTSDKADNEE